LAGADLARQLQRRAHVAQDPESRAATDHDEVWTRAFRLPAREEAPRLQERLTRAARVMETRPRREKTAEVAPHIRARRLRVEHQVGPEAESTAVDRGRERVIGAHAAQGDERVPPGELRLREEELEL